MNSRNRFFLTIVGIAAMKANLVKTNVVSVSLTLLLSEIIYIWMKESNKLWAMH